MERKLIRFERIRPQGGTALELFAGQVLRVTSPEDEQVADVMAFSLEDPREWLSSGRSIDYASTIFFTNGSVLFSNRSREMMRIIDDTVGRHDFLLSPCSQEMFERLHGCRRYHPSCFENLAECLSKHGLEPDRIATAFNAFMHVDVDGRTGEVTVKAPRSRAGDFIEFKAQMDLVVGVTACSAELTNNGSFKPIDIEVFQASREEEV